MLTYSSNKELTNSEELNNIINSFNVLDNEIVYNSNTKIVMTVIFAVIVGLLGFILSTIFKKRK